MKKTLAIMLQAASLAAWLAFFLLLAVALFGLLPGAGIVAAVAFGVAALLSEWAAALGRRPGGP